jgi:predicted CopG family antitoxin
MARYEFRESRERSAGIRSLHGRFPAHPYRNGRKLPGNRGFAPTAQSISPRMADTMYMQTIEISDKLYKKILAHRHGEESISKTIERKFKQEKPEKKSKALQEIDEIRKGKFYIRTQVEEALKG